MKLAGAVDQWIDRTLEKSNALEAQTPVVHGRWTDDDGNPVAVREGRRLARIPGESHADAFQRATMNARTDLWRAGAPDILALFLRDHVTANAVDLPGAALASIVGAAGDLMQGAGRLGSAGAYGIAALYHRARS
ncbi:MAG: hypothetical protein HY791_10600 [Deltaproteobacteria bacterium]|nr:hypothetical protein [Deltaproteobacteria bacterium]